MAIIFVTGVSTAGKTSTFERLRNDKDLSFVEFHDIDEEGIPATGTNPWRHFRVELLLHEAVDRFRLKGTPTVICGVTKPHEVIESGSFPEDIPVHFILLDVSIATMASRLQKRLVDVSEDNRELTIQLNRILSYTLRKSVRQQRNGVIVNPAGLSRTKVGDEVKGLVLQICTPPVMPSYEVTCAHGIPWERMPYTHWAMEHKIDHP